MQLKLEAAKITWSSKNQFWNTGYKPIASNSSGLPLRVPGQFRWMQMVDLQLFTDFIYFSILARNKLIPNISVQIISSICTFLSPRKKKDKKHVVLILSQFNNIYQLFLGEKAITSLNNSFYNFLAFSEAKSKPYDPLLMSSNQIKDQGQKELKNCIYVSWIFKKYILYKIICSVKGRC